MATLNIFVSFEFNKENKLKSDFFGQAKKRTNHRIRNRSLNEAYPDDEWKRKARKAIDECDVVIVLVGEDTHNAQGVIVETDMARDLNIPTFQVRKQKSNYQGLTRLNAPIPWKWKLINEKLDAIAASGG